ncbi:hypothetical protein DPMN_080007 [Dreissena polymorpha]|uniref:Uncharacterized protein n=1 Tax=Dreissena polymorpha TaxID=45954 RepID=A0A9D3YU64_DREPO|nr:hypothetical protein DPMN_080007 [Dreissena polymorpha]
MYQSSVDAGRSRKKQLPACRGGCDCSVNGWSPTPLPHQPPLLCTVGCLKHASSCSVFRQWEG